jgi:hypothetical protein
MPMERVMQPVGLSNNGGLACAKCGQRATFLCPLGALCPTDALIAAAHNGWIPTHIRDTPEQEPPREERPDNSTSF